MTSGTLMGAGVAVAGMIVYGAIIVTVMLLFSYVVYGIEFLIKRKGKK